MPTAVDKLNWLQAQFMVRTRPATAQMVDCARQRAEQCSCRGECMGGAGSGWRKRWSYVDKNPEVFNDISRTAMEEPTES